MKLIYFFLIFFLCDCVADNSLNYCGNKSITTPNDINKLPFFRDVDVIKLSSFKMNTDNGNYEVPVNNGKVDMNGFFELKTISKTTKKDLLNILVNYSYNFSPTYTITKTVTFCYNPRNAILFLDKNANVLGYTEICFECFESKSSPATIQDLAQVFAPDC